MKGRVARAGFSERVTLEELPEGEEEMTPVSSCRKKFAVRGNSECRGLKQKYICVEV